LARKTSTTPTRIWTFGARKPLEETQASIKEQLYKANRYYNRLIEIERERRSKYREARTEFVPRLAELERKNDSIQEALEAARQELRSLRQKDRQRTEAPAGLKTRIAELVSEARAIGKVLKTERAEVTEQMKKARDALAEMTKLAEAEGAKTTSKMTALQMVLSGTPKNILKFAEAATRVQEDSYQAVRDARGECGVYWGTYLLIEEAAKTAAAKALVDPRFKRFDGSGRIGVQVQGGISTEEIFGGKSTMLQIDPLPVDQWDTRSGRRHAYTKVRIRVGTAEKGRQPVWAEFPLLVHRKLPEGVVKSAWIQVQRVGTRTRYRLQMMVEAVSFAARDRGKGTVALDVGWRSMPNGNLRVAYWVDSKGQHGALELPAKIRTGLTLANSLRGFSDVHFEAAKKVLRDWLGRQTEVPDWMTEATAHIAQWRQPRRLASVAFKMEAEFAPDAVALWKKWKASRLSETPKRDLFGPVTEIGAWLVSQGVTDENARVATYLSFWRMKNRHLLDWENNQREKALGHRKDLYNQWAKWLAKTYEHIVLEDFDLRTVAKRVNPEDDEKFFQAIRYNREVAAVSELRLGIKERLEPDRLLLRPSLRTIITCHSCRHVEDFDKAAELVHTCPGCKRTWDQDWNAAANLLLDVITNDPNAPSSREPSSERQAPISARKGGKQASGRRKEKELSARESRG
jgi:hypothetical protein